MYFLLIVILLLVLILPFVVPKVEENLELFLFVMGFLSLICAERNIIQTVIEILSDYMIYFTVVAVLVFGLLFRAINPFLKRLISKYLIIVPLRLFVFLSIIILALGSCIFTGIVAAILLVEIVHMMPFNHKNKTVFTVIACFAIGVGSVLTPLGGPLPTVISTELHTDFWHLFFIFAIYAIPCVLILGIFGALYVGYRHKKSELNDQTVTSIQSEEQAVKKIESKTAVFRRTANILIFIVGVEMLGAGFKPVVAEFLPKLNTPALYWLNTLSAILDNATMAAAEYSANMPHIQVVAAGLGLCIAGGILIPGNITNVICASGLKIKPKEWAKVGIPLGLAVLCIFFVAIMI